MVLILVIRAQFLCQRTWTVKNTRLMEGDTCGLLFERVVKQHNYDVRTFSRILERFSKHYIIDISHTRQPSKARASDNFQGYLHIEFPLFARKLIFADLVTLAEIALRPRGFYSSTSFFCNWANFSSVATAHLISAMHTRRKVFSHSRSTRSNAIEKLAIILHKTLITP